MLHQQKDLNGAKHSKTPADRQSTTKSSVNSNTGLIAQPSSRSHKVSYSSKPSMGMDREFTRLGFKTTDSRGKQRNWAILGFEAALARAREAKYARSQPNTASGRPVKILSPTSATKGSDSLEGCSSEQNSMLKQLDKKNNAKKKEFGYFFLPGEIRNMIMGHLFRRPEQVLPTSNNQAVAGNSNATLHVSGWQFLATCYQAYLEGRALYRLDDDFHLAPGPLVASNPPSRLKDWEFGYQCLVSNVTMHLSIVDLTPAFMNRIETVFYENCGSPIAEAENEKVACYIRNALHDLLVEKIAGVRRTKAIKSLKLIRMQLLETDEDDDRYTQCVADTLTIHSHQWTSYFGVLEKGDPTYGCSQWGRASAGTVLYSGWHFDIRVLLYCILHSVEQHITRRLRWGGNSKGCAGWVSLKLWLERLQVSTRKSA